MNPESYAQVDKQIVKAAAEQALAVVKQYRENAKEELIQELATNHWWWKWGMTRAKAEKRFVRGWDYLYAPSLYRRYLSGGWEDKQTALSLLRLADLSTQPFVYLSSEHTDFINRYKA